MKRNTNQGRRLPDIEGEPNFYEISRKYPLPAVPPSAEQAQAQAPQSTVPHQTVNPSNVPRQAVNPWYGYPSTYMGYPHQVGMAAQFQVGANTDFGTER